MKEAQKPREIPPKSEKNRGKRQKFFYTVKNNAVVTPSFSSNSKIPTIEQRQYHLSQQNWLHENISFAFCQKTFLDFEIEKRIKKLFIW